MQLVRINLLPEEHKRPEGLPAAVVGAVLLDGLLVAATAVFFQLSGLALSREQSALADLKQQQNLLMAAADQVTRKEKDLAALRRRQQQVLDLRQTKILWSRKLDLLLDLVPSHTWINSLEMRGTQLEMDCVSRGQDTSHEDDFRDALRAEPNFWRDFAEQNSPNAAPNSEWDNEDIVAEHRQNRGFKVILTLKPRQAGVWEVK